MNNQLIPKVTSSMLKEQPDQFINIINRVIDECNQLKRK